MKNKLKKHGIAILVLIGIWYIICSALAAYAKNHSDVKMLGLMITISISFILVIVIVGIAFIVEVFQCCILYCENVAKQKGLPESYKWFGLLLVIGIIILMWATPEQEKSSTNGSVADELIKFKELYNQGIITKEELLQKKNELLEK